MNFLPDFTLRGVKSWFIPPEKAEKRPNHGKFGWNSSSSVVTLIWSLGDYETDVVVEYYKLSKQLLQWIHI